MKIRKTHLKTVALAALGVVLGRGAQADTVLNFDVRPAGQAQNAQLIQTFGDNAFSSSDGVVVNGFGTPNIGLTWNATGGRWDYYADAVWASGQLDSSNPGDTHDIVFTPNNGGASVVLKSFNFFPYYLDPTERFTFAVSVLSGTTVLKGPINLTFTVDGVPNHPVDVNYTGAAGQTLTLRIARLASTLEVGEVEGAEGNIAVDDITFAQLPETYLFVGPSVVSVSPANNSANVAAAPSYRAVLTNQTSSVVAGSVGLKLNGTTVTPVVTPGGDGTTTITYQHNAVLPSLSTNRFTLTWNDNSIPARSYTNETAFAITQWVNRTLPDPFITQNFDSTPEGSLPPGWTSESHNDVSASSAEIDFGNLDSAVYTNWTVIEVSRLNGPFVTYSDPTDPIAWQNDYMERVLRSAPNNVINNSYVGTLASGRVLFGNSGYRNDPFGQILFLFSPDFNLTSKTDVYLSFNSLWEQNHDSIASVEYSVDSGATWLPIVYMLDVPDIATNTSGAIDAVQTFSATQTDTANWIDSGGQTRGGFYGAYIGVASNQWSTLAPYISGRVNDNSLESKRVEIFRLPEADNKPAVRFRFAHAGTDAWYWAIDNFALHTIPSSAPAITGITRSGTDVIITWPGAPGVVLEKATSLQLKDWTTVPNTDGASSATVSTLGGNGFFRLKK